MIVSLTGSCTYAERAQQQVVLLDDSRVLPVVRETIELCMSRGKVRTLHEWEKMASSSSSKVGPTSSRSVLGWGCSITIVFLVVQLLYALPWTRVHDS